MPRFVHNLIFVMTWIDVLRRSNNLSRTSILFIASSLLFSFLHHTNHHWTLYVQTEENHDMCKKHLKHLRGSCRYRPSGSANTSLNSCEESHPPECNLADPLRQKRTLHYFQASGRCWINHHWTKRRCLLKCFKLRLSTLRKRHRNLLWRKQRSSSWPVLLSCVNIAAATPLLI